MDSNFRLRHSQAIKWLFVGILTLVLLAIRRWDAFYNPQFWAEDFLFLITAEKTGLASFIAPQAGYLHMIPRTTAYIATYLASSLQPAFFVFSAISLMLTVVLCCMSDRLDLPLKPWLALSVVVVPHSGEVFFNPTNSQWVASLAIVLTALKTDAVTKVDWTADFILLFFAGLSGPFIIFALPLFAVRAYLRRSNASYVLLSLAIVFASVQYWFVSHSSPDREFIGPFSLENLLAALALRVPLNLILAIQECGQNKSVIIAIGFAIFCVFVAAAFSLKHYRTNALLLLAFVCFLAAAGAVWKRFDLWAYSSIANGDRYFFVPKVIFLWVLGITFKDTRTPVVRRGAFICLLSALLLNAPHFRFNAAPDTKWLSHDAEIRAGKQVVIEINPGWKFRYQRDSQNSAGPL